MKLIILKEKLEKGLNIVSKISTKKLTLPILSTVLIEVEKNFLKLTSTNLETGVVYKTLAKVDRDGKICANLKFLSSVISSISEDTIELETDNLNLILKTKSMRMKIKGASVEEFPILPSLDNLEKITLEKEIFIKNLQKLVNIPTPSLGRPEISGIYINFEKNKVKFVATDSFRLFEKNMEIKKPVSKAYSLILPQSSVKEIISILEKDLKEINFYINPNQIFIEKIMEEIEAPEILYTSRLIEGEYPNYEEIIPKKYNTKVYLNKESFIEQVRAASFFSGRINEVRLEIKPKENTVFISSQNPDYGEYKGELKTKIEGEEITISFNHRFLVDGLSLIDEKEIEFLLTDQEGPAILRPLQKEDYFYILMPIKTS